VTTPGLPVPPRPCLDCTTPTRNKGQRCDTCRPAKQQTHNTTRAYYHTPEWRRLRTQCLARDYQQCVICTSTHRLTAHHLHARKDGGPDTLNNLTTLCHTCHDLIERQDPMHTTLLRQHLHATRQPCRTNNTAPNTQQKPSQPQ